MSFELSNAVRNMDFKKVKKILTKHNIEEKEMFGWTPLFLSIKREKYTEAIDIAEFLIKKGADINVTDENGISILENSMRVSNDKMVKLLIKSGVKIDKRLINEYPKYKDIVNKEYIKSKIGKFANLLD